MSGDDLEAGFRMAFRRHPAGVAIVTALTAAGPIGLTASSVASVAVAPAALSFSVTADAGSASGVLAAGEITVHLLAAGHHAVARAFATHGAPRFTAEQGWRETADGRPALDAAAAQLRCRIAQVVPVGASRLVVAEVLGVVLGPSGAPLVYADRAFHTLAPLPPGTSSA